uniref:Uncharacterized protein n=1 Tax=Panagrellus redivivus TaxID=6233 RepID=A0A7E4V5U2_PANRE
MRRSPGLQGKLALCDYAIKIVHRIVYAFSLEAVPTKSKLDDASGVWFNGALIQQPLCRDGNRNWVRGIANYSQRGLEICGLDFMTSTISWSHWSQPSLAPSTWFSLPAFLCDPCRRLARVVPELGNGDTRGAVLLFVIRSMPPLSLGAPLT